MVAGSDTTATAIRGTLMNIMTASHVYQRLQGEIDSVVASGSISSPIKSEEARKLAYLQVRLKGLYSPGYIVLTTTWAHKGCHIRRPPHKHSILRLRGEGGPLRRRHHPRPLHPRRNKGWIQHSLPPAVQRRLCNDADLYWPERWLEIDEAKRMRWRQHVELVFGGGRWGCSGKNVAFMELNKMFVKVCPLPR